MYELHGLHLSLHSSQQLSAELLLASIFRKRLASSQKHASHAVRDLFNHVYLFSSTTRAERGVMRGSAARYGRLLVNTTKVPLLVSTCRKTAVEPHDLGQNTVPLTKEVAGLILITDSDDQWRGADSRIQGQSCWGSQDTTHQKQTSLWHLINPKHRQSIEQNAALFS